MNDPVRRHVFDISDLIQFWRENIRPTGIQRVQSEVLREVMTDSNYECVAIYFDISEQSWAQLPAFPVLLQIKLSGAPDITKPAWRNALAAALGMATAYAPAVGDALINLGSSWWIPDYMHKIQMLRRNHGVRYVPFIHDTIPLSMPQYCVTGLVDEFRMWFRAAVSVADHIIVNSHSSARDVHRWAHALINTCCDISIAPLNAAFARPDPPVASGIRERLDLTHERYVLCVGTLEARKNHILLLRVWEVLARRLPEARMAKLVLVGKQGWMFDAAAALLAGSRVLSQHVLILTDLSDHELAEIYDHCDFTVYPSFYEGWGLPVTEAISHGKLTIASNTSSLPEAASAGDILLDPNDVVAWSETIGGLLEDPQALADATAKSVARAKLRTWRDIAADILVAASASQCRPADETLPIMQDGVTYDFRAQTALHHFAGSAGPLRNGAGWHQLEHWGAWSAPGTTELRFAVGSEAPRYLYIMARGAPEPTEVTLCVDGLSSPRLPVEADGRSIFRLSLPASPSKSHVVGVVIHHLVDLGLRTSGADRRKIGIGFLNMMCCERNDFAARLNFNETLQMHLV